ncbi:hypothetical protein [Actinomadura sp. NTSP31]|uniref:hypothetical protein n=1 Tax=Actinomadura sp. NTSP31 TaxID=1735447 RepID=UPI0035BF4318
MSVCKIHKGQDAHRRLDELGLGASDINEALREADEQASLYRSEVDARNASGLVRWARTVGVLRGALSKKGWGREDPQNLPLAVNPATGVAIIVTTADGATGFDRYSPKTLYPRGKATVQAAGQDPEQLSIMDMPEVELAKEMARAIQEENQQWTVWFLLYHYDNHEGVIRTELSRPDPIDLTAGRRVEQWLERILLEKIMVSGAGAKPD